MTYNCRNCMITKQINLFASKGSSELKKTDVHHNKQILAALPKLTQPSTLHGMVKRASVFRLSNIERWQCMLATRLAALFTRLCLSVIGHCVAGATAACKMSLQVTGEICLTWGICCETPRLNRNHKDHHHQKQFVVCLLQIK